MNIKYKYFNKIANLENRTLYNELRALLNKYDENYLYIDDFNKYQRVEGNNKAILREIDLKLSGLWNK